MTYELIDLWTTLALAAAGAAALTPPLLWRRRLMRSNT